MSNQKDNLSQFQEGTLCPPETYFSELTAEQVAEMKNRALNNPQTSGLSSGLRIEQTDREPINTTDMMQQMIAMLTGKKTRFELTARAFASTGQLSVTDIMEHTQLLLDAIDQKFSMAIKSSATAHAETHEVDQSNKVLP